MLTTRRELLDDFLDFVGEPHDSNARSTASRILNRALQSIWMKQRWRQFEMPTPFEFVTVAGQRSYALPENFGRLATGVIRNLTRTYAITGVDTDVLQHMHPEQGTSFEVAGRPETYIINGTCGVDTIVSAIESLTVASANAADIDVVVTVEGWASSVRWQRQQVTLNGVTPVAIPLRVIPLMFGKSYAFGVAAPTDLTTSRGVVTLSGAVNGQLAQLLAYQSAVERQVLTLFPTPDVSGDHIAVPFLRAPVRSLYDGDPMPQNWEDALMEELLIQWRVNTGESAMDTLGSATRPKLLDLIAFENANRFGVRSVTRPFTG